MEERIVELANSTDPNRGIELKQLADKKIELDKESDRLKGEIFKKTPSAPFVTKTTDWVKLGLKVALKEAVRQGETMKRNAFKKLVDEKMDWVEARMKKMGKLEVKCP